MIKITITNESGKDMIVLLKDKAKLIEFLYPNFQNMNKELYKGYTELVNHLHGN